MTIELAHGCEGEREAKPMRRAGSQGVRRMPGAAGAEGSQVLAPLGRVRVATLDEASRYGRLPALATDLATRRAHLASHRAIRSPIRARREGDAYECATCRVAVVCRVPLRIPRASPPHAEG